VSAVRRAWARRFGRTVALLGPDGAGKSTVSRLLTGPGILPYPVKVIYMGVNPDAASLMLPTTRVARALRRATARHQKIRHPHQTRPATGGRRGSPPAGVRPTALGVAKDAARLGTWVLEEWYRQGVAWAYLARGYLVIYDRHFVADYHHTGRSPDTPTVARVHGWLLRRAFPRPALLVCLDAPAAVVYARKREDSVEWLEQRRADYLQLAASTPGAAVVDATASVPEVVAAVATVICTRLPVCGTAGR
jgi:thymidylate kinase